MIDLRVVRINPAAGFVLIANGTVRPGGRMSAQDLGVLVHLLSHRNGELNISAEHLAKVFSNGVSAMKTILRNLETLGHLHRKKIPAAEGFVYEWTVCELPFGGHEDWDAYFANAAILARQATGGNPTGGNPTGGNPTGSKKTLPSEDQLEEDVKFSGSSATRPTTRDRSELALILGETDPLRVAATWLAIKAEGVRNPLAFARSLAERGELDGYLGTHIYADDFAAEAANL